MKLVRSAQIVALILVITFIVGSIIGLVEKSPGGIYGTLLAPFWIFFPGIFGLAILRPYKSEKILQRMDSATSRAKSFLIAIGMDIAASSIVHFYLGSSADAVTSFAFYLLASPIVFFAIYAVCYFALRPR